MANNNKKMNLYRAIWIISRSSHSLVSGLRADSQSCFLTLYVWISTRSPCFLFLGSKVWMVSWYETIQLRSHRTIERVIVWTLRPAQWSPYPNKGMQYDIDKHGCSEVLCRIQRKSPRDRLRLNLLGRYTAYVSVHPIGHVSIILLTAITTSSDSLTFNPSPLLPSTSTQQPSFILFLTSLHFISSPPIIITINFQNG